MSSARSIWINNTLIANEPGASFKQCALSNLTHLITFSLGIGVQRNGLLLCDRQCLGCLCLLLGQWLLQRYLSSNTLRGELPLPAVLLQFIKICFVWFADAAKDATGGK